MKKQLLATGLAAIIFTGMAGHAFGQTAAGFQLKNRSTFSNEGKDHDPFWPIGWARPRTVATAAPAAVREVEFSTEGFVLTSILLGRPALAVINGKEYAEGEMISYEAGGQKIPVQVAAVQDGSVVLRYRDRNYTVLLHRKGEEIKRIATTEEAPSQLLR